MPANGLQWLVVERSGAGGEMAANDVRPTKSVWLERDPKENECRQIRPRGTAD
jgi:hypothetical protein